MDTYERLFAAYESRTKDLKETESRISGSIQQTVSADVLESKLRVLAAKLDVAISTEDEKKKLSIQSEIEKIKQLAIDSEELRSELKGIQGQISLAGRKTLEEIYPKIREAIQAEWGKTVDATEQAWADLQRFERETGTPVSLSLHRGRLGPLSFGTDKALERKLRQWI